MCMINTVVLVFNYANLIFKQYFLMLHVGPNIMKAYSGSVAIEHHRHRPDLFLHKYLLA